MNTYQMRNLRVVNLARVLNPKTESRGYGLIRFNIGSPIPDFHTIMNLTSHPGTHVECPYHHNDNWSDMELLPITTLMSRAIYVSIGGCKSNHKTTGEDLEKACGDRTKEGDIVIIGSPMKLVPFTSGSNTKKDKRLSICRETAEWFRKKKVKCVGFGDSVPIKSSNENVCVFHDVLMEADCVFLEVLKNLEELTTDTLFMFYSPLPTEGLDLCPARAYTIEGLAEFSR